MKLDQFDKLHVLVKELEEKTRILKHENHILKLENKKLNEQISTFKSNPDGQGLIELKNIKNENELLKTKNKEARTHLAQLISRVEGNIVLEKGVG